MQKVTTTVNSLQARMEAKFEPEYIAQVVQSSIETVLAQSESNHQIEGDIEKKETPEEIIQKAIE